jgi:hypothetical protein
MALTKVSTGVVDMSGNTGGLVIAKGTDVQKPTCDASNLGSIRENIDENKVEVCTAGGGTPAWRFFEEVGPTTAPLIVDYLVVAGGGGGASGYGGIDGGSGGAGGLITSWPGGSGGGSASELPFTFTLGTPYTVTVGDGGSGAAYVPPYMGILADSGDSSVFNNITALGGGGSRSWGNSAFQWAANALLWRCWRWRRWTCGIRNLKDLRTRYECFNNRCDYLLRWWWW